ncbi:MAG: VOC family protein [Janthinobacterium lividum]
MGDYILGLHHLTAIASDPQRNFDFYVKVLGRRFIKKTINFNDPALTVFTSATK